MKSNLRSSGPQIGLQLVNPGLILQARRFYAEVDEEKLIISDNIPPRHSRSIGLKGSQSFLIRFILQS